MDTEECLYLCPFLCDGRMLLAVGAARFVDLKLKGFFGDGDLYLFGDPSRVGDRYLEGDLFLIGAMGGTYFKLVVDDLFPGILPPGIKSEDDELFSKLYSMGVEKCVLFLLLVRAEEGGNRSECDGESSGRSSSVI